LQVVAPRIPPMNESHAVIGRAVALKGERRILLIPRHSIHLSNGVDIDG